MTNKGTLLRGAGQALARLNSTVVDVVADISTALDKASLSLLDAATAAEESAKAEANASGDKTREEKIAVVQEFLASQGVHDEKWFGNNVDAIPDQAVDLSYTLVAWRNKLKG